MATIKRKTRKAITRQVKKLVKKHGPEKALGMATALVGSVVAATTGHDKKRTKKKPISDLQEKSKTKPNKRATASKKPKAAAKKKPQAAVKKKSQAAAGRKSQAAAIVNPEPLAIVKPETAAIGNPSKNEE